MKYIRIGLAVCVLATLHPLVLVAQSQQLVKLRATVYGQQNNPVNNVLVKSMERENVTVSTGNDGVFELEVRPDEELEISAGGYEVKYLKAAAGLKQIKLSVDPDNEKEVQVAFRTEKKKDLMGDVSFIDVRDLMKKNYFTYSLDGMDALVPGYNGNSLWAMGSYLTLVDGVPRDANNVLPTEIDQISFLKGVNAVALYGSRAAKGVIYIKTKRGEANNRRVDVTANVGGFTPKSYPKYLGAAEYMTLYNEARVNDGLSPLYGSDVIYRTASKQNPYRYPDLDFYTGDYLKQMYNRYDATAEISGGNERARYYTNLGFFTAGSLLDFGRASENNRTGRFNVRGNVDIDLNDYITGKVDASATFYNGKGVNADYWGAASTVRPNRFAPLVPISMIEPTDSASLLYVKNSNNIIDGKYLLGGTQLDQTNAFASVYAGGYNQYISRQFQFNAGVGADLRNVLKGLKFQTNFAVDYATAYNLSYNYTYAVFQPAWNNYSGEDLISSLTRYGQDATSGTQNVSNSWYRQTIALSGGFTYANTFDGKHNVSGLLMANGFQLSESAIYHRTGNANLGLQLGYNYADKYYADFSSAYIHSAKLPEGNRQAFSPTLSLAWRISKEDFMNNTSSVIDDLKFTASAGILNTDLDINDYYLYQGYYTVAGSWYGWKDGTGFQATESRRGNNPDMIFPKRKEINAGFEGSFFNRLLHATGTFFVNKIEGNLIQASVLFPSYFTTGWPVSSFIPYVNYNNDKRAGFDFSLNLNKQVNQLLVNFGLAGTYYTTKANKRAEIFADDYQYREGKPLDGIWGLESIGFYSDANDIKNSPVSSFGQVHAGDIKYKDQNNDGVINAQDQVFLGKGGWFGAPFTMGANLTLKWKKLTFYSYGIARMGGNAVRNNSYFWVYGDRKYSEVVRNRWTEATKATATYPRLTTLNSDNNFQTSDFWMYKTNRFDLSKIQLSYDLTSLIKANRFVKELGAYVSGSSLLTVSPERETLELNIGSAPQTRFYNFGIKALF